MSLKNSIEAILFLRELPITLRELSELTNERHLNVKQAVQSLIEEYLHKDGALEIRHNDEGYLMSVKQIYSSVAQKIVPPNIRPALLRTLAAIALKEPLKQSELVRLRGGSAYEHVKELKEMGWLHVESPDEQNHSSPLLSLSLNCKRYFGLSEEGRTFKAQLQEFLPELEISKELI